MKILLAHNSYQQPGGEDQSHAAEVALLEQHGHEVISYRVHNDAIDAMSRVGVAARTLWNRTSYREVRALIRMHRPQIAHFNNTFPLISPAAYYAARAENVPVVQTLRNYRLLCPNALFYRDEQVCEDCLGKLLAWPGVVHGCYRGSRAATAAVAAMLATHRVLRTWRKAVDVYIALTAFAREKFIRGGLPAEKIAVRPNFVFPDPGRGEGNGKFAIYVGRLSAEKGLTTLLAAWSLLNENVPLKIVGDGPQADLVSAAAQRDPRIEWLGRRSADEVARLLGDAACLVFPSQCYEGMPRGVIEAFAAGTPVVASRLGAMQEMIDHGRTGWLFEPASAPQLAAIVASAWQNLTATHNMRPAARREFETKYTSADSYQSLMKIYERAIAARGGAALPHGEPSASCLNEALREGTIAPALPCMNPLDPTR